MLDTSILRPLNGLSGLNDLVSCKDMSRSAHLNDQQKLPHKTVDNPAPPNLIAG